MSRNVSRRLLVVVAVVFALMLAVPPVALADNGGDRFSVFESISIRQGETVYGDAVSIFGSVSVAGHVTGSAVSIFGSVSVTGRVGKDAVSVFGSVTANDVPGDAVSVFGSVTVGQGASNVVSVFGSVDLGPNAVVRGNATTIFGRISTAPGAQIRGDRFEGMGGEIEWPPVGWRMGRVGEWWGGTWFNVVQGVIWAVALAGLGVLAVILFPRHVETVKRTLVVSPWSSLGVGFLAFILAIPLTVLLVITCIGPLVLWAGIVVAAILGMIAIGLWVGERTLAGTGAETPTPVMAVLAGTLIVNLLLTALGAVPFVNCFTWLLSGAVWCMAFGAVILSRFGTLQPLAAPPAPPAPLVPPEPPVEPAAPSAPGAPGGEGS